MKTKLGRRGFAGISIGGFGQRRSPSKSKVSFRGLKNALQKTMVFCLDLVWKFCSDRVLLLKYGCLEIQVQFDCNLKFE